MKLCHLFLTSNIINICYQQIIRHYCQYSLSHSVCLCVSCRSDLLSQVKCNMLAMVIMSLRWCMLTLHCRCGHFLTSMAQWRKSKASVCCLVCVHDALVVLLPTTLCVVTLRYAVPSVHTVCAAPYDSTWRHSCTQQSIFLVWQVDWICRTGHWRTREKSGWTLQDWTLED